MKDTKRIAILGGGPSGLFMFKRLVDAGRTDLEIHIFEKKKLLGAGMPYSQEGAGEEHITNVSGNEIPELVTSIADWIETAPKSTLERFNITPQIYNDYKVLPRLLFGEYLSAQFELLKKKADEVGLAYEIHYNSTVTDITDYQQQNLVQVQINGTDLSDFHRVIVCTGHNWPHKHEGKIPGYFDSPYPPMKLHLQADHPVAIKGASLTAVDALRTLARANGSYYKNDEGKLVYQLANDSHGFKMVMHTRNGLLPAVRFHLEDSHLSNDSLLTEEEIAAHIVANDGFLSLDYIFEQDFKEIFRDKEPEFYQLIKNMSMETFVNAMMAMRENLDPFELMKLEYREAEISIKQRKSVYWKEMLGVLSFAMNYPAKHFSAEDMRRLQKTLAPLISVVIAYIPQSSCEEIFALHNAGVLEMVIVGDDGEEKAESQGGATYHYTDENGKKQSVYFKTFVNCVGQPHLSYEDFPFKGLLKHKTVSPARLKYRSLAAGKKAHEKDSKRVEQDANGDYYMRVAGITINDSFNVVDDYGALNERLYIMAVPYIGGLNPDYSGLDFCEEASERIITSILKNEHAVTTD